MLTVTQDEVLKYGYELQREKLAEVYTRTDLLDALSTRTTKRLRRVLKTIGRGRMEKKEISDLRQSALGFGFLRALLDRFSTLHNLDDAWWLAKRKKYARNGRDRTNDLSIIAMIFPEFHSFFPHGGLTDTEILEAATREFYDMIAAPGTDYYYEYHGVGSSKNVYDYKFRVGSDNKEFEPSDPDALQFIDDTVLYPFRRDSNNIYGPIATRALALAVREYGQGGLFWFVARFLLPDKCTEVLRTIGLSVEELGVKKFEALRRDFERKLPQMDECILSLLREDPDVLSLRELLAEDRKTATPTIATAPSLIDAERKGYISRQGRKLLAAIAADKELVSFKGKLEEELASGEITPTLALFINSYHDLAPVKSHIFKEYATTNAA